LSFLLLGGCLVTFHEPLPSNQAAPKALLGKWSSKDAWGEPLKLTISRSGGDAYKAVATAKGKAPEEYVFTVSRHGNRWYLSAGVPKRLGGNFLIGGFDIVDGKELVVYNLDVEQVQQAVDKKELSGRSIESRREWRGVDRQPVGARAGVPGRPGQLRPVRRGGALPALRQNGQIPQHRIRSPRWTITSRRYAFVRPHRAGADADPRPRCGEVGRQHPPGLPQGQGQGAAGGGPRLLPRPLSFDSSAVKAEFQNIERDITRQLGQFNPVGQIMRRMCKEYRMVVRMLEARGTEDFGLISQELYGAASDAFHAGDPTLADLGLMLSDYLNNIDGRGDLKDEAEELTAKEAVEILQRRLNKVFGEAEETIRVFESDGIVADAAAGADYIKVRADAMFNAATCAPWRCTKGWCTSAPRSMA
jgi:hypothetical protein